MNIKEHNIVLAGPHSIAQASSNKGRKKILGEAKNVASDAWQKETPFLFLSLLVMINNPIMINIMINNQNEGKVPQNRKRRLQN